MFYVHRESVPCERKKVFFWSTQTLPLSLGKVSVCRDPLKGSVGTGTSLLLPKQLIHRKGNHPLLKLFFNAIDRAENAIRGSALNHESPWNKILFR